MHRIDSELDKSYANYRALIDQALQESPNRAGEIKAAQALFDHAVLDSGPVRAATLVNSNAKAMDLMRASVDAELQRAREAILEIVTDIRKSVDKQSAELTAETHQRILYTWLVIVIGLAATFALALIIMQGEVVRELFSLRDSIQDLAAGKLDQTIPYLDRNNEIGEISRALQTLQRGAREREIQGWVKSEVASTLGRLQGVRDFPEFATALLSCLSESIPLIYGGVYLADESRRRFSRIGAFAIKDAESSREFALGEGLVGQAAVERRPLTVKAGEHVQISAGLGTVSAGNSAVFAGTTQGRSDCGDRIGAGFAAERSAAGVAGCVAAIGGVEHGSVVGQHRDQKTAGTDASASPSPGCFRATDHGAQRRAGID